MKITFKQFRALSTRELGTIYHEADREMEARNTRLSDGRFVHDDDMSDDDIDKLFAEASRGSPAWYVLKREKFGRVE